MASSDFFDYPPLNDIALFCQVCDSMKEDHLHKMSLADHAERLGFPKHDVERAFANARRCCNKPLYEKGKGNGKRLTWHGSQLHQLMKDTFDQLRRFSAPLDCLKVPMSTTVQSDILPRAIMRFYQNRVSANVRFWCSKLHHRTIRQEINDCQADFAVGWNVRNDRDAKPFGPPFYMGVITMHDHPLARAGEDEVRLEDVAKGGWRTWTLPPNCQIPEVKEPLRCYPERLLQHIDNYNALVGLVLKRSGIGIVPLWTWRLDRLRPRGLYYVRLANVLPHYLSVWGPEGDNMEKRLTEPAAWLLQCIKQTLNELAQTRSRPSAAEPEYCV